MTRPGCGDSSGRLRLDHVVIRVDDLEAAVEDYRSLGFEVCPGGHHADWGSTNAIVPLADDTYLELIAFGGSSGGCRDDARPGSGRGDPRAERFRELERQGRPGIECRILSWAAADEGIVDLSLLPADTAEELNRLRRAGLSYDGPIPGSRRRPDGWEVRWEMGISDELELPFLCGDLTPRSLRVPVGPARQHGNGVRGISEVVIAANEGEACRQRYRLLLGTDAELDPGTEDTAEGWVAIAAFQCGEAVLRLATASRADSPLARHLERRGPGPFQIGLRAAAGRVLRLDDHLLHGAVIR